MIVARCTRCSHNTEQPRDINQRCRKKIKNKRCKGVYRSKLTPWEENQ